MSTQPKVVIVILNWNGLADTLECLGSLSTIDYVSKEVVVVDNGSESNEADAIKRQFPDVHLIKNKKNLGYTGGCNQGMQYALEQTADYVLLLNNDTVVTADFLKTMVEFYETTSGVSAISPLILYADQKHIWFAGGKLLLGMVRHLHKGELFDSAALPKTPFASPFVPGTAMLISTQRIAEVGVLDDRLFLYYEDVDWCARAQKLGLKSYVVPQALVYHKKSKATGQGGQRRFSKVPAYYIARNPVLLASDYGFFKKLGYLLAQVFIKLPLSLLLLIAFSAWGSYIRGLAAGFRDITKPRKA